MRPVGPDLQVVAALAARIFPRAELQVARVEEGVSTFVYRVRRGVETFYLRVLPEEGDGFAPEALAHALLRERGVRVPEVIYVEHYSEEVRRSVMVTTEMPGRPLGHCPPERIPAVLAEAARDLSIINSVPADGFGWINRDHAQVTRLEGDLPTYRAFVFEHLEADLALLHGHVLQRPEIATIRRVIERRARWLDVEQGRLAHGDFDATHIYQQDGRYTGVIDFGEIRGTDPFYDLGHFLLHDGETLSYPVFPLLLAGYRDATVLPDDHEQRIRYVSMLIAIRALARQIGKGRNIDNHRGIGAIRRAITALAG